MRTLLIACGNPMCGDDGIADTVVAMLERGAIHLARTDFCSVQQLTPELATGFAAFGRVIFLDADASAVAFTIVPVSEGAAIPTLTHISSPTELVNLARALFSFSGEAWLCRIPAHDLSFRDDLTPKRLRTAEKAARSIAAFLLEQPSSP